MIVIRYLRYYPKLIFSKSMFRNWDNSYGVIKGPLEVFTKIKKKFHHCNINSTQIWIFSTQQFKLSSPKPPKTKNITLKKLFYFSEKKLFPYLGWNFPVSSLTDFPSPSLKSKNKQKKQPWKNLLHLPQKHFPCISGWLLIKHKKLYTIWLLLIKCKMKKIIIRDDCWLDIKQEHFS